MPVRQPHARIWPSNLRPITTRPSQRRLLERQSRARRRPPSRRMCVLVWSSCFLLFCSVAASTSWLHSAADSPISVHLQFGTLQQHNFLAAGAALAAESRCPNGLIRCSTDRIMSLQTC
ncbi:hypothetical protein BV20DRAFT_217179 [Pilatotrama ljubarskyi]|nr:hypothetical protein BV20DRAFT_217179 [Pilatotrama ljubarskyi]